MPPINCCHCAMLFMDHGNDPSKLKLCNSCEIKENLRNPKEKKMDTIAINIQVPSKIHREIEEICINKGIDFSIYFIDLHNQLLNATGDIVSEEVPEENTKKRGRK